MNSNGKFVNTVIAVTSALVVLGIAASIASSFHTHSQLAAICVRLESLQEQNTRFEKTKVTVEAAMILLNRINDNHSTMRKELTGIRDRIRELEAHTP